MFQYLKVITIGEASASAVLIGTTIGEGKGTTKVKEYSKTLQVIYLIIGSVLGFSLFFLRIPLLSLYDLTQNAYQMADQILIILSIVMVGMSYQMPTGIGIIKGGGDVKYMMYLNLISTWAIVMPLSFLGAFVWKLPVPMVVLLLNSDQLFKCIPTYLYVKKDKWIKVLVWWSIPCHLQIQMKNIWKIFLSSFYRWRESMDWHFLLCIGLTLGAFGLNLFWSNGWYVWIFVCMFNRLFV